MNIIALTFAIFGGAALLIVLVTIAGHLARLVELTRQLVAIERSRNAREEAAFPFLAPDGGEDPDRGNVRDIR